MRCGRFRRVFDAIERERITLTVLVPAQLSAMMALPRWAWIVALVAISYTGIARATAIGLAYGAYGAASGAAPAATNAFRTRSSATLSR